MHFTLVLTLQALPFIFATRVVHNFGTMHADLAWTHGDATLRKRRLRERGDLQLETEDESNTLRVMHITDAHVSRRDEDPPHTHRMYDAMLNTVDRTTGQIRHPADQLVGLFRKAREENVDLIALGGDIINFPSKKDVDWLLDQLEEAASGIPFIYTAGNHDWHLEGVNEARYDSSRLSQLSSTLLPLFERSATGVAGGGLYGYVQKKGVDILFFDNSNYQIDEDQLAFAREHFGSESNGSGPALILLHMPLALPGVDLPPKEVCGHPNWGTDTDDLSEVEGRARWPRGNLKSTNDFMQLVQSRSAPAGRIIALMTGHVHLDFETQLGEQAALAAASRPSLACGEHLDGCQIPSMLENSARSSIELLSAGPPNESPSKARGALQYSTLDAAEGGYRMVTVRQHIGAVSDAQIMF